MKTLAIIAALILLYSWAQERDEIEANRIELACPIQGACDHIARN